MRLLAKMLRSFSLKLNTLIIHTPLLTPAHCLH
nr:MAG TPA: hypothetical protein [Caudoviricetes sp.]